MPSTENIVEALPVPELPVTFKLLQRSIAEIRCIVTACLTKHMDSRTNAIVRMDQVRRLLIHRGANHQTHVPALQYT